MLVDAWFNDSEPSFSSALEGASIYGANMLFNEFLDKSDTMLKSECNANVNDLMRWVEDKYSTPYLHITYPLSFGIAKWWLFTKPYAIYREGGIDFRIKIYQYMYIKIRIPRVGASDEEKFAVGVFSLEHTQSVTDGVPIPIDLLNNFVKGRLEGGVYRVVEANPTHLVYLLHGNVKLRVPKKFIRMIGRYLGSDPIKGLKRRGLIDDMTYRILRSRSSIFDEAEKISRMLSILDPRDVERLKVISRVSGALSYGKWAMLLGISKSGAYRWFKRMVDQRILRISKAGGGVRVEVSDEAKPLLRF